MLSIKRVVWLCVMALAIGGATGCTSYETDKANKLIDSTAPVLDTAAQKLEKANKDRADLETRLAKAENEEDLEPLRAQAKGVIADFEKTRDSFKEAAGKFEETSKLKLQDKAKEYYGLRAKELTKRAEIIDALIAETKALIESESPDEYQKKAAPIVAKIQDSQKEADDLKAKAEKIAADNKAIFKD
jgi:hypothetical protein